MPACRFLRRKRAPGLPRWPWSVPDTPGCASAPVAADASLNSLARRGAPVDLGRVDLGWGRDRLFAAFVVLAAANAASKFALGAFDSAGTAAGLTQLLAINAFIWLAFAVVVDLAISEPDRQPASRAMLWFYGLLTVPLFLPSPNIAALILTAGALAGLVTANRGSTMWRIAVIALALSANFVWGPALLRFAGPELLNLDTALAGWVGGASVEGNLLTSVDGTARYVVSPGCASLANVSRAVLLTVTLSQALRLDLDRKVFLVGLAGALTMVLANTLRLASYTNFPADFAWWHDGPGMSLTAFASTLAVGAVVLVGLRYASQASQ